MVTTRGSSKSKASHIASSPTTPANKQPAKSSKSKKDKDHGEPGQLSFVPQTEEEDSLAEAASKQTSARKRKRTSEGSRKSRNNVGPQSKAEKIAEKDDTGPEQTDSRASFEPATLKDFIANIKQKLKCCKCKKDLQDQIDICYLVENKCPPEDYDSLAQPATHPLLILSTVKCPSNYCNGVTCLGCGSSFSLNNTEVNEHAGYGCQTGWYVALWMQLVYSCLSRAPMQEITSEGLFKSHKSCKRSPKSETSKTSSPSSTPAGIGYASGNPGEDFNEYNLAQSRAEQAERANDKRDEQVLKIVSSLLRQKPEGSSFQSQIEDNVAPPRKARKSSHKSTPNHETQSPSLVDSRLLPTLFHWSGLLRFITQLFHDDSLDEAYSRHELYLAALDLVEALLDNEHTSKLVTEKTFDGAKAFPTQPQTTYTLTPDMKDNLEPIERSSEFEGSSVSHSMDNILMACDSFVNAAASMPKVYKDKRSRDILGFAQRIQELGQRLGKENSKPLAVAREILPQAAQSCDRFELLEENVMVARHTRAKDATFRGTASSTNQRMRVLHKELHMLRTSLPIGIYVKMASTRPDIIKALIIGPEGTPYEGGLFEFDVLCTRDYPQVPPKVDCATAAREEARPFSLNPNLYNNGYVCLSVINTWHGARNEQWLPGKSTILQVLVSIQSMVLGTATPADNEPGGLGTPHEEFNRGVQAGTIKAALLPWLQASELRNGVWKDTIDEYFKANAAQVLATIKKWAKDNNRITEYHPYKYPYIPMPLPEDFIPPPMPAPPGLTDTIPQPPQQIPTQNLQAAQQGATHGSMPSLTQPLNHGALFNFSGVTNADVPINNLAPSLPVPPMLFDTTTGGTSGASTARAAMQRAQKIKTVNLLEELEKALKEYL